MRKVILLSVTILLVISLALIVLADFCTECGTELPKDAKFCPKCGKKAIITEKEHVPLIRGKIIFSREDPNDYAVYGANLGESLEKLVSGKEVEGLPAYLRWSPDGTKFAFISYSSSREDIYVYDWKNKNLKKILIEAEGIKALPNAVEWLRNGTGLVAGARDAYSDGRIWVIDINSGKSRRLISSDPISFKDQATLKESRQQNPVVSPDGSKIAFHHGLNGYNICIADIDGSGVRDLLTSGELKIYTNSSYPFSWSPDSKKIVFSGAVELYANPNMGPDYTNSNIYEVDVNSAKVKRIPQKITSTGNFEIKYSPNGKMIATPCARCEGESEWKWNFCVINIEDGAEKLLPNIGQRDFISWTLDSQKLLCHRDSSIILVGLDGTEIKIAENEKLKEGSRFSIFWER